MLAPRLRAGRSFFIKEVFLVFERVYDYRNLYEAYIKARKQKRYRGEVLQFSYALEENLIALQNELIWKTYKVGAYRPFVIYEPKKRQIVALPFRDRVVQHALNAVIEPMFERRMIHDSYACRVGKGTHQAARRVAYYLGKPGNYYYLKADVKSFFASVNRTILRSILAERIEDEGLMWLVDEVLNSTPGTGLPIGNLMSQLFANVYLHELDHYIKNVRGVKFYVRYMDDFLILHESKAFSMEPFGRHRGASTDAPGPHTECEDQDRENLGGNRVRRLSNMEQEQAHQEAIPGSHAQEGARMAPWKDQRRPLPGLARLMDGPLRRHRKSPGRREDHAGQPASSISQIYEQGGRP
jgi:hypothetical protein